MTVTNGRLPKTHALAPKLDALLTTPLLDPTASLLPSSAVGLHDDLPGDETQRIVIALAALTHLLPAEFPDDESAAVVLETALDQNRVDCYKRIVGALEKVVNKVNQVETEISSMAGECDLMRKHLSSLHTDASTLIEETARIQEKKKECMEKKKVVESFLSKFTLSREDLDALSSPNVDITKSFFVALKRLHQIQLQCKQLLASGDSRIGLDIMQSVDLIQENAYDKLFNWAQNVSRTLTSDVPEIPKTLPDTLHALRHRSVLLRTILDDIIVTRQVAVARGFTNAMVHGGSDGLPKPIELQAHDPMRYIGDMLACVHQLVCGEKELLDSLFEHQNGKQDQSSLLSSPAPNNHQNNLAQEHVYEMLEKIMENVCRPLKVRVEQVFASQTDLGFMYRTANLVQFYTRMITKSITGSSKNGPKNSEEQGGLLKYLHELTQAAFQLFYEALNRYATDLLKTTSKPDTDLVPVEAVKSAINLLKELMASYDSSMVLPLSPSSDDLASPSTFDNQIARYSQPKGREHGFDQVLSGFVDPLIQHTTRCSDYIPSTLEQSIYHVNVLHYILSSIQLYPSFTTHYINLLSAQIEAHVDILATESSTILLSKSGLLPILAGISESQSSKTPMSRLPNLDSSSVHSILSSKFDPYLCSIPLDLTHLLNRVMASRPVQDAKGLCLKRIVSTYREMETAIMDPKNGYEFPRTSVLVRTAEEVETVVGGK